MTGCKQNADFAYTPFMTNLSESLKKVSDEVKVIFSKKRA